MNRFFRSALFPLVVIVLLVYLASQTLIPNKNAAEKFTYSQLIEQVSGPQLDSIEQVFDAPEVGRARSPYDAGHLVALFEQQLGEVGAVLPGDASN